jgi:TonB family protein
MTWLTLTTLLTSAALAQAPTAPAAPPPDEAPVPAELGPRLPQVAEAAGLVYPPDRLAQGVAARVVLELDIDEVGIVVDAVVVESAGPDFDAAALQAALSTRFTPALDGDGVPSLARIQYALRFEPGQAIPLSVEGSVVDEMDGPVPGTRITATGPDGAVQVAESDSDGNFRFAGLAIGTWQVEAESRTLGRAVRTIETHEGTVQTLRFRLVPEGPAAVADFEIEVIDRRASTELTERVLTTADIAFLPGTNGDVVKAVQNLPGVGRPPLGIGQLIIRGTAPEDSAYYLDGGRIPLVFHFSGLTTVLNGDSLEEVAFLPSNYSVRYGRTIGGVVELRTTVDLPDADRTYASVDVYQATAFVERRLGDSTAITVSGRRSYIDAVLSPLLSSGDITVQAPRYWDVQARVVKETERAGSWDALFLASDDRFRFLGGEGDDAEVLAALGQRFAKLRLKQRQNLAGGWSAEHVLLVGPEQQSFQFEGDSEALEERDALTLRSELNRPTSADRWLGMRVGLDLQTGRDHFLYDIDGFGEREEGEAWFGAPGIYSEAQAELGDWTLIPGARLDTLVLQGGVALAWVDPRLSARYQLFDQTVLKGGTGLFSQPPTSRELLPDGDGNPDLGVERAWQSSLGVEQKIGPNWSTELTAFTSFLSELVSGREDRFYFFSGPPPSGPFDTDPYANDGTGLVYGVEGLARYTTDKTVALVALTLSHSERTSRPGDDSNLFTYDQPIVLNALASRELNTRWRVGARVRYGSGNPDTPVVNRIWSAAEQAFVPVYGERDSSRLDDFFSLDLRVDRTWKFERWDLTAYLDLQNATYAKNTEVMGYTFDYSEPDPVEGLPPVPAFGFKGEW